MSLIIDVETTGLPIGKNQTYDKLDMFKSARVVQVTMMLCNAQFEKVELFDFIVKTNGYFIDNSHFHGITNEISARYGVPFIDIAHVLHTCLKQVSHVVAHNAVFDISILSSELYRLGKYDIIAELQSKHVLCTMKQTMKIVNARNTRGAIKSPSLAELFYHVFKTNIENAHNSMYDVINLHQIVKNLYDTNQLVVPHQMTFVPFHTMVDCAAANEKTQTDAVVNETSCALHQPEPESEHEREREHECNGDIHNETNDSQTEIGNAQYENNNISSGFNNEMPTDFSKLKLSELRQYCKTNKIKGVRKLNKCALINHLQSI